MPVFETRALDTQWDGAASLARSPGRIGDDQIVMRTVFDGLAATPHTGGFDANQPDSSHNKHYAKFENAVGRLGQRLGNALGEGGDDRCQ